MRERKYCHLFPSTQSATQIIYFGNFNLKAPTSRNALEELSTKIRSKSELYCKNTYQELNPLTNNKFNSFTYGRPTFVNHALSRSSSRLLCMIWYRFFGSLLIALYILISDYQT